MGPKLGRTLSDCSEPEYAVLKGPKPAFDVGNLRFGRPLTVFDRGSSCKYTVQQADG